MTMETNGWNVRVKNDFLPFPSSYFSSSPSSASAKNYVKFKQTLELTGVLLCEKLNYSVDARREWKNVVWIVETHAGTRLGFCSLDFISFYLIFVLWSFYTTSCLVFEHRAQLRCRRRRRRGGKTKNEYTKHVRGTRSAFRFQNFWCVVLVVVCAQWQRSFV